MGAYELFLFLKDRVENGEIKSDGTDNTVLFFMSDEGLRTEISDIGLIDEVDLILFE